MDSRDSSPSAPENSMNSTEENPEISAAEALASDAAEMFQSGKFAECLDVLRQVSRKKPNDPKVLHNIAIAEYFHDGCSDPKKLLDILNNVKTRSEELARASQEQEEIGGNKSVSGSKLSGTLSNQLSDANGVGIVYGGQFDTSVASLNMAVTWFHIHEFKKALSVLRPLYKNIGPIDETTAVHICLLFLDAALAAHDASTSGELINYLDKAINVGFTISQGDNGSVLQQQFSNLVAGSSSLQAAVDSSIPDSSNSTNAPENSLSRNPSEEITDYENFMANLDTCGDNLPKRGCLSSSSDLLKILADRPIPRIDLKLKLQLYKVQFLLLTRNLKAVKREVKEAMNMARGRDSSMALLLKSQLEFARGNHRKAIKLLMASSNRTEAGILSIINNNFGSIYYQLGKYHTSSVFFSKALSTSSSLKNEKPRKLLTFSQDMSHYIVYNCGLQHLACGKPVQAARCFKKSSLVFNNQPLLWLRISECCLMALEKGLLNSGCDSNSGSDIRLNVIGKGKWRQLVVENEYSKSRHESSDDTDNWFLGDNKESKLSMPLARQCVINALHLLNSSASKKLESDVPSDSTENEPFGSSLIKNLNQITNSNGDAKEQKGGTNLQDLLKNSVSDYEENCEKKNQMIKQAVLANLTYIELELGNPLKALSTATSLLNIPECSRIYIFLGHVYAAEALCLLNQPKEAAEHLSIYLLGENKVDFPYGEEDCSLWREGKLMEIEDFNENSANLKKNSQVNSLDFALLKPEEAIGTMYVNLAAFYSTLGELEQAHIFAMESLSALPDKTEAILTAVYVEMRLGKTHEALAKLKQARHVRFIKRTSNHAAL